MIVENTQGLRKVREALATKGGESALQNDEERRGRIQRQEAMCSYGKDERQAVVLLVRLVDI